MTLADDAPPPERIPSAEEASTRAATRIVRGQIHKTPYNLAPKVTSKEQYDDIAPGLQWVDPTGELRTKPYAPKSPDEYRNVPEGADWLDPQGNVHTKPVYEDISYSAQTLYNMAQNDAERKKVLNHFYPGKVKTESGTDDLYIEDEGGKMLRPRGFGKSPFASLTAAAAPTAGAIAGEVGGALAGSALPGPGTLAGAIGGAAAGGAAGQVFNDFVMKMMGLTDRTAGEEALGLGESALGGGVGTAIGRTIGATAFAAKKLSEKTPANLVNLLAETDPEKLALAISMKRQGLEAQPVSPQFPGLPHVVNIVEVYDRAMHPGAPPIPVAAEKFFERKRAEILTQQAAELKRPVGEIGLGVHPTAAVDIAPVGQAMMDKAKARVTAANARLQDLHATTVEPIAAKMETAPAEKEARLTALRAAEEESRKAATNFINEVYNDIFRDIDAAVKASGAGRNSGEMWERVAEKFKAARQAFGEEAAGHYERWAQEYGGIVPERSAELGGMAQSFLEQLPESFRNKNPDLVRALARLGGVIGPDGAVLKEAESLNLSELQGLRTMFRHSIDWEDLRSNWFNGVKKKFEGVIDSQLNSVQPAGRELDKVDAWYRENGAIYSDRRMQAVISGLRGNEPADPKVLFDTVIKEGRTDLNRRIQEIVGPNLWRGVQAADADALMQSTKTEVSGQVDGAAFARGVLGRHRDGMLESIHGKETAQKWLNQIQNMKLLDGDLPIDVRPGDQITDVIAKLRVAVDAVRKETETDPLKLLKKEFAKAKVAYREAAAKAAQARAEDPLDFLANPKMGAEEAAKKILGNRDLIMAAEKDFGRDSDEFKMLQQAWAKRMLTNTMDPGEALGEQVTEEIQRMMFPGVTYGMMQTFAKEMGQIMGTRGLQETAKSMAAQSQVEHPQLPFIGRHLSNIPVIGFIPRAILSQYFTLVRKGMNSLWLMEWLQKGLESKDPVIRAEAKRVFRQQFKSTEKYTGVLGAGIGESETQTREPMLQDENPQPAAPGQRSEIMTDEQPDPLRPGQQFAQNERLPTSARTLSMPREVFGTKDWDKFEFLVDEYIGVNNLKKGDSFTIDEPDGPHYYEYLGKNSGGRKDWREVAPPREPGLMSDEQPDPLRPGQQFAMADESAKPGRDMVAGRGGGGSFTPAESRANELRSTRMLIRQMESEQKYYRDNPGARAPKERDLDYSRERLQKLKARLKELEE